MSPLNRRSSMPSESIPLPTAISTSQYLLLWSLRGGCPDAVEPRLLFSSVLCSTIFSGTFFKTYGRKVCIPPLPTQIVHCFASGLALITFHNQWGETCTAWALPSYQTPFSQASPSS